MIETSKLMILMALWSVVHGECTNIKVLDANTKKDMTKAVCLEEYSRPWCMKLYNWFTEANLPPDFPQKKAGANGTGMPIGMQLYGGDNTPNEMILPLINVTWESPEIGRLDVDGYFLLLLAYQSVDCVLFSVKRGFQEAMQFQYVFKYVKPTTAYQVKVYTLPPNYRFQNGYYSNWYISMTAITGAARRIGSEPATWAPFVSYSDSSSGMAYFYVEAVPRTYNMAGYRIQLYKKLRSQEINLIEKDYPGDGVVRDFIDVFDINDYYGEYYNLTVTPIDRYPMKIGSCNCWLNGQKGKVCTCCRTQRGEKIYLKPEYIQSTSHACQQLLEPGWPWLLMLLLLKY